MDRDKRQKQQRCNFLGKWAGYILKAETRNTMIRDELNIPNLNVEFRIVNLNAFQNSYWTTHLEEQDPLDSRSYAGRINLSSSAADDTPV
jgi:hypothetical protein